MARQAAIDEAVDVTIDGEETASSWKTKRSSMDDTIESPNRAREGEPAGGPRQPAPPTVEPGVPPGPHGENIVNELDAAYEAIPEAEREAWYEWADQALEAAGMPEWMRITPTVKEMALRLWVGSTMPAFASGVRGVR